MEEMVKEIYEETAGLITENRARQFLQEMSGEQHIPELRGTVLRVFPAHEFERNGRKGKVQRLLIRVEGKPPCMLVLWNDHVDAVQGVQEGSIIRFSNPYFKDDEWFIGKKGKITVETIRQTIKTLEENARSVFVSGTLTEITDIRTFERDGRTGTVWNATLTDETGSIRLVVWNNPIRDTLKEGMRITVKDGYLKNGELHTGKRTIIHIHQQEGVEIE